MRCNSPIDPNNIIVELWGWVKILFSFEIHFPIISAVTMIQFCNALPASVITRIRKVNEEDDSQVKPSHEAML